MVRNALAVLLVFLLFIACPRAATADPDQPPLRIAFPEFPPFHWHVADGRVKGIFHDMLVEALEKRMGLQLTWTSYPWMRCQENLKNGVDDAIITVPTKERGVYTLTHSRPFFEKPLHVYTAADHPRLADIMRITSLADIKQLELSVITYIGNGWHNDNVRSLGIATLESPYLANVWPMLSQRRGDLVIEWPLGAQPELQRLGLEDSIVDTGIVPAKMPFFLLIRKDSVHTRILDRFEATIEEMHGDGSTLAVLQRYQ